MKIIAYGSLLNTKSLERTLGRPAELTRLTIPGVRRVFNAPFGQYAFLNIEYQSGSFIEAGYFTLTKNEIDNFAEREKGSVVVEVLPGYLAFVWPRELCRTLPVLQSYIDICQVGCDELGIDLQRGTAWPSTIINDREFPYYH